jgi:hypothetical protein
MKRLALFLLPLLLIPTPQASAKPAPLNFRCIVLRHFDTGNNGMISPQFVNEIEQNTIEFLLKDQTASMVVPDGAAVSPADAANSLLLETKITYFEKGGLFALGKINFDIGIYRLSDHALVRDLPVNDVFPPNAIEKAKARIAAMGLAQYIRKGLEFVNLASVPAAAAQPAAAAPAYGAPVPAGVAQAPATPAATDVPSSVQLTSLPTGAEITIDGNYQGSTPSTIKLRPGTHSIKVTKNGFLPWVRSIEIGSGESRSIAAELDPAKP